MKQFHSNCFGVQLVTWLLLFFCSLIFNSLLFLFFFNLHLKAPKSKENHTIFYKIVCVFFVPVVCHLPPSRWSFFFAFLLIFSLFFHEYVCKIYLLYIYVFFIIIILLDIQSIIHTRNAKFCLVFFCYLMITSSLLFLGNWSLGENKYLKKPKRKQLLCGPEIYNILNWMK